MAKRQVAIVQAVEHLKEAATTTLREEVKESLRSVLRDPLASAAAKASAGRTLLEYFDDTETHTNTRRGADMTAAEIDHAIALFEKQ